MKKMLIPCLYLKEGGLVSGFKDHTPLPGTPAETAVQLARQGADMLFLFDLSEGDAEHEKNLSVIRDMIKLIDLPVVGAGNIKRSEDVKKLKYAGCRYVALNMAKRTNIDLLAEVSKRFGKNSIFVCADVEEEILNEAERIRQYSDGVILLNDRITDAYKELKVYPVIGNCSFETVLALLSNGCVAGVSGDYVNQNLPSLREIKAKLRQAGLPTTLFEPAFSFSELKTAADGLIPVVTQDYRTGQVLMVAYMNREAYDKTVETGIMTYFSRSRQSLWIKGETSGHFQYVRELSTDCDRDTILAKVKQIGAACHTGSYSCFFNEILKKEEPEKNPARILEDVYEVILDRKENPREGSYTNYLFEKGIDKILKKVGEEATEIVIAAKNPDKEEVRYEMADFLYHMMVLMAECGLSWEDITEELANRS
ncbi:MAG: bifunctional phosphoribosyl-AMP cyclohydrolase/phosphoribosyl-ATP diphosphatase HisIE [Lachnospiraceae bacterium]|nr:bifunctional phosphoribosyl-AMP cyclohydrolase/phosphoribosyl-ATP diphosphatase HisIE [Lachnospiraceae bacterium]